MPGDTMTHDDLIERLLQAAHGQYVAIAEMMRATSSDRHAVVNTISRLRHRYGERIKRGKGGYALVERRKSRRELPPIVFNLPDDLWRGWCNPLTGICAVRLGLEGYDYLQRLLP